MILLSWQCILRLGFMAHSNPDRNFVQVFVDQLSIAVTWRLLWNPEFVGITVLDPIPSSRRPLRWLLAIRGVEVLQANFFAGDLKSRSGECVVHTAWGLASAIALRASAQIVDSNPVLRELNHKFKRSTIQLVVAKKLQTHIVYWTVRAHVVGVLSSNQPAELWLRKPDLFEQGLIAEAIPEINLKFYSTPSFGTLKLLLAWAKDTALREIRPLLQRSMYRGQRDLPSVTGAPSVLMFQENTNIRADRRLRAQPHHWVNPIESQRKYPIFLIETRSFGLAVTNEDKLRLKNGGIDILPQFVVQLALLKASHNDVISKLAIERRHLLRAMCFASNYSARFFMLQAALLLKEAQRMAALVLYLNAKVFLNREPQFAYSDALQLVADELGIMTISYQYSNLGVISPLMMTTADRVLIFADMYKMVLQDSKIRPGEFLTTGYLYDGIFGFLKDAASKHRATLNSAGATFMVCYFDETATPDRYGLVSTAHHLSELHALAQLTLADPTIGVILKSQYMRNSPSQLYPDDHLIKSARATGRYLELMEGVHRNEIYPAEAALAADLVLSHKFGATAGLEAALAGVRTVLINAYGTRTHWDDIYAKVDIEYESIDEIIAAIKGYRSGIAANQRLGDWSPILGNFDPWQDGKAAERMRDVIEQAVSS
jgi:hypothetical protein